MIFEIGYFVIALLVTIGTLVFIGYIEGEGDQREPLGLDIIISIIVGLVWPMFLAAGIFYLPLRLGRQIGKKRRSTRYDAI